MNEKVKLFISLGCFILFIVLATCAYNVFSKKFEPINKNIAEENEDNNKESAIDFEMLNYNGESVKLSDFYGKPIIVNFWATWCPPCCKELPLFNEASKAYNDSIEFIMVNLIDNYSETIEGTKEFIAENEYSFPVYFDKDFSASNAYSIYSIPQTLFIDKDGNIVASYVGMLEEKILEDNIQKIINNN